METEELLVFTYLFFSSKFQQGAEMLSLDLSGCQCQSKKSTKGRHFILYRQDSLPLYGQESGIELLIPQEYQG